MEDEPKNLPVAFADSVASEKLVDVAATAADIGLDAAISSGALDGVPILGALVGLARGGLAYRDWLFQKKVATFLNTFEKTPLEDRQAFIANLEKKGKKAEFGETVLLLLDRADDMKKPEIIARVMSAAANGKLSLDEAIRLAKIVDRAFSEDLRFLLDFKEGVQKDKDAASALFSAGLLVDVGIDGGLMMEEDSGGTMYDLNRYGKLLSEHGLKDH
ncbi:hypothetical protein C7I87_24240 [Mesorhizobium sp. SARCC-RB16n]|uniref:hypothetical protein n=1 Tax=Mesorhizobium sp. SARCC-RB16n TaxID=2116687 RepID=UPI00122F3A31|nr:hypothetical protein [Mesorhizobium sp. SARCC-RB16n]KAA3448051.1 hypothetical protein C7I87_24240 [Mesorhizobium sp. SARCC-RB16n]